MNTAPEIPAADLTRPRRSAWRWLLLLLAMLLIAAALYGALLRKRYREALALRERMEAVNALVYFELPPDARAARWLADQGVAQEKVAILFGQATVMFPGEPPGPGVISVLGLSSSERIHTALAALPADARVHSVVFWHELIDDESLTHLPAGFRAPVVTFDTTPVTEQGLRDFCRQHRPRLLILWDHSLPPDAIPRLRSEFPGMSIEE